jgi:protoheme IX farnesyltransferase
MSDVLELHELAAPRRAPAACALALAELAKVRIVGLVAVVTAVGFGLGAARAGLVLDAAMLMHTLLGTAVVGAAANALNQYLERDFDVLMDRTRGRPLPSGRLAPLEALGFGSALAALGTAYLALQVNVLCSALAGITLLTYVLVYTPMKRRTPMCVYIGAVPGALPPLIGWSAATGSMDDRAWILFAVLFLWQLPHFAAIAWQYREDYARAGFPMLSVLDRDGWRTNLHVVTHTVALVVVSLLPVPAGLSGPTYAFGAALLGLAFLACGIVFLRNKTAARARFHVLSSVTYLPLLLGLMMIDAK